MNKIVIKRLAAITLASSLLFLHVPVAFAAPDFNKPAVSSTRENFPAEIRDVDTALVKQDPTTASNIPEGAIWFDYANGVFKRYESAVWTIKTLAASAIADASVTFAKLQNLSSDRLIGRDASGSGVSTEISVTGGLEFTGSNSIQIADSGVTSAKTNFPSTAFTSITVTPGSGTWTPSAHYHYYVDIGPLRFIALDLTGTTSNDSTSFNLTASPAFNFSSTYNHVLSCLAYSAGYVSTDTCDAFTNYAAPTTLTIRTVATITASSGSRILVSGFYLRGS